MIDKRDINELRERLSRFGRPMLSLYATVNPALPEINPQAVYVKVKNTLKQLDGVPPQLARRVLDFFEGRPATSRSLALFADTDNLETIELEVDRFLHDGNRDHLEARWGEPYMTPLLVAMDENERYGVAFVDRDRLRFFQIYLGEIEELITEHRSLSDEASDEIESNKQAFPEYIPSRGGAEVQLAQEHIKGHQLAFYRTMRAHLREAVNEAGIRRLVLMGPEEDTHALLAILPPEIANRVTALVPSVPTPQASAHDILERVSPTVNELIDRERIALLDRIRERGIVGLDACLHALQEGRLHTVAVPEALHQDVYIETETSYVSLDEDECKELISNGGEVRKVDLAEKLPELAETWGARLEFVRGDAESRLLEELGGMGGLRRW